MGSDSGSSKSSSPPWQTKEVRFAPYVEARHSSLLDAAYSARISALNNSPYADYTDVDYNTAIVGIGYTMTDFSSLYDLYGSFMSGFDIEVLWGKSFDKVMNLSTIDGKIDSDITMIDETIKVSSIPELKLFARDVNTVCSSSFVISKALIESSRIKELAKFSADDKYNMLQEVIDEKNAELSWQKSVTDNYAALFKTFYLAASQCTDVNYKMTTNDVLWNLNMLDFERAALGAFHPRSKFEKPMPGPMQKSNLSKFIEITLDTKTGAEFGIQFGAGNPFAAAIGAAIGFHIGVTKILVEENKIFEAVGMNTIMSPEFTTYALGRAYNNW
jgi:hypothetical protein